MVSQTFTRQELMLLFLLQANYTQNFDKFKEEHKEYTKRGFSMLPVNELLNYWNESRDIYSFLICIPVQETIPFPGVYRN